MALSKVPYDLLSGTASVSQLPAQLSINSGASSGSLAIDSAGRVTMPYQPAFIAYINTSVWQGYSNQTIVWTSTSLNTGNHFNTSTGAFTAPVNGLYHLIPRLYVLNLNTSASVFIQINGASDTKLRYNLLQENTALDNTLSMPIVTYLNANDVVSLNYTGDLYTGHSSFMGYLIG